MFNLFKKQQARNYTNPHPIFNVDLFIAENPIVIYTNDLKEKLGEMLFEKDRRQYVVYAKIPFTDENGNEVEFGNKAVATYSFTPEFVILSSNIYTKKEFDEINLQETKKEELKRLISRIENL